MASEPPKPPQIRALLVDYGEVISLAQPAPAVQKLASLAGLEPDAFVERYWLGRRAYDAGQSPVDYWAGVLGNPPADGLLDQLIAADVESWLEMNQDTLALLRAAKARGLSLALLSNAPEELAEALDQHPALAFFDQRFYSSRLKRTKPDRAIFDEVVAEMGRQPAEVLFIDDRPENVEGALAAGLAAIRFSSAAALAVVLPGRG